MEPEYLERLLDARLNHLDTKIENIEEMAERILHQTTSTQVRVEDLEEWQATTKGYWKAVNRAIIAVGTLLGIVIGAIATYLWH